ncbi:hypothetical protein IB277_07315 [Ensifer sp. ENS07]|uniref:hypothetical protein n=1 Tax=Ensifer sp. ENS07 TaxID=2769274 RepID=UPI001782F84D|nr:hypothetical protein [Ensifer sp. ENS07]MBD9636102.1 hypothetical protein [Ensifer sp. ENS07]
MTPAKRIRGYALAIDHHRDSAYFLDGSPVLAPETVVANDNLSRRLQFIENPGARLDTSRCRRVIGDVFCADHHTAAFVREAVAEKLARETEEAAANTFRIFGADICEVGGETVLKLAATRARDSQTLTFDLVLQSGNPTRERQGQWEFTRLCKAVGLTEVNDCELLHGLRATFKELPDGSVDFRAPKAA